ncbi:MAG: glucoamylase family protein, partial [Chitinophagaceae bacterium]
MAHPLNQAIYDPSKRRVTEGYGILQPRVSSRIPKNAPSPYLHMQGNVSGIDPYTRVSSDVYQDIFGEGSFIGKGIYDVDIFEETLQNVFQENRILSHDLLEGCYARSGLLSDVIIYEENPSQYWADIKRQHRWIRGDWQIGAWMLPFITDGNGKLIKNKLSTLSRWKIFDNLRRSLLPPSLILFLLMGWTLLPYPWFWTLTVTLIILLTVLAAAGWQLLHKPIDLTLKAHFSDVGKSVRDILFRFIFGISVLPYEAYKNVDAILRTNWRLVITKKKLLEWTPSSSSYSLPGKGILSVYLSMWVGPLLALICFFVFLSTTPGTLFVASPFLILWFLAPALAWSLSTPELEETQKLPEEQNLFLHKTARKIWSFFEQFVTQEENWLPPDNIQEQPVYTIAHRTSPTNIGLTLLANLAAYDFGYISEGELVLKSSRTIQTLMQMERYRGHFYNWYDTKTLLPLHPKYVSTVDSGNFIGHILTLRQGFLNLRNQPILNESIFSGLRTTIEIIKETPNNRHSVLIDKILSLLDFACKKPNSLFFAKKNMDDLELLIKEFTLIKNDNQPEFTKWVNLLSQQIKCFQEDLIQLVPWLELLPVPVNFIHLLPLDHIPTLFSLKEIAENFSHHLNYYNKIDLGPKENEWLIKLQPLLEIGAHQALDRIKNLEYLAEECEQLSWVEYDFLFDKSTNHLRIGFNVEDQRKDDSYYDLLASESRLGVFVGISQGKLPQESWFALGRLLTNSGSGPILLSWSGSMFEYLMPQLIMPSYENTLLAQTNRAIVKRQIEYGGQRDVPWGISESAYSKLDASLNYQYRAFGVPGLGLKRGLDEDLVVAPYSSMLALMISPGKACSNLQLLSKEGFEGEFGFYEAIDYTPSRLSRGKNYNVIHSFMVHHQAMGLLSLAYVLLNKPMQKRFISELRFQATLLLLQERIPKTTLFYVHNSDLVETHSTISVAPVRRISTANTSSPEIQLLGNGRYQVMVTNSGGGYSRWKDIAVTRWREDPTQDNKGIFCYIKDINSGKFWSNTFQPTLHPSKTYEAIFSQGHIEFNRNDYGIDTRTEIVLSPEDDTEMRRIRITNKNLSVKFLEITSYAEIVMASQSSDEDHQTFSNLFVQTEIIRESHAIFCSRRPRSDQDIPPWMFHLMEVQGVSVEAVSYETDRMEFIGRGKSLTDPKAMEVDLLSGHQGPVLDPILSIRYRISVKPNQTATIDLIYGISDTREACEGLVNKYRDQHLNRRAFELSWTHSQVLLRQINTTEGDAQLYDRLAGSVIYPNPHFRGDPAVIKNNFKGQSGMWSHSVSGDLPIVLIHIYGPEGMELVKQMVKAHAYWRLKGLALDLVIWNEDYGSYRQDLQEQLLGLVTGEASNLNPNKPGNIFIRSADQISTEDRTLFESVARVIIYDNRGTLSEQVNHPYSDKVYPAFLEPKTIMVSENQENITLPDNLQLFNGIGGFTPNGKEYKIIINHDKTTPAPWVNIIANQNFGTVISESGSAYTWAINA